MGLRILSKWAYTTIIISFFMPIISNMNGPELIKSNYVGIKLSIALCGVLMSALAGSLILILIMMKKRIPLIIDWLILIISFCSGVIPFFLFVKKLIFHYQIGAFMICICNIVILIYQLISL